MKYNEAMKKNTTKSPLPWILTAVMTAAVIVLAIGASDSVKRGSGFLFIPSNTPTDTATPTFTPTATLTPTATATAVPTDTVTPLPTFDGTAFAAEFFAEVTQTAAMEELLRTPSATPIVPDEALQTGMRTVNPADGADLIFIRLSETRADGTKGFWIDWNEISANAYASFAGVDDSSDLPAVNMTREQASAYCGRAGMTLMSLADWQDAAASGVMTDADPNIDNRFSALRPGTSENCDLIGNAWEWTVDDLSDGRAVIAGGSWMTSAHDTDRTAAMDPRDSASDVGFRCVRYIR